MAENTEHYNLVKLDYADAADVSQLNDNMDIIDGILWQLANAGADEELLKKVQEILDKIGETDDTGGSYVSGSVMSKLNESLKETESIGGNVDTLIRLLSYGVFEKSTAGSFTVTLPETVSKIKVTACAGGGGGAGSTNTSSSYLSKCYSGGGGGQAIVEQEYEVEPGATITGTVGGAGSAGTSGNGGKGGNTIIDGVVTLVGGAGGVTTDMTSQGYGNYAEAGGSGGGDAGAPYWIPDRTTNGSQYKAENGKDGILGKGGKGAYVRSDSNNHSRMSAGSGGGGSLGNGGDGTGASSNDSSLPIQNPTAGTRGGGGGGGGSIYRDSNQAAGKAGGAGYIKIVWGY